MLFKEACDMIQSRRRVSKLNQREVAQLFGFAPSGYQTFGAWERGDFAPPSHRRFTWVCYLSKQLDFAHDLELFEQVWHALTSHWKWEQGLLPATKIWLE